MTSGQKLLIVEDEEMLLESLVFFLADEGFQISEARNGKEALDLYHPKEFDLILTDIRMPVLTGDQVIKKIAPQEQIPLLVFSGYSDVPNHLLRELGATDIIAKPVDFDTLLKTIERRLGPHFSNTQNNASNIKLLEKKHLTPASIAFGRDGFFIATKPKGYQAGDLVRFELALDGFDQISKLQGIGKLYWANQDRQSDPACAEGMMVDILSLDDGITTFEEYIKSHGISSSIPLLKAG